MGVDREVRRDRVVGVHSRERERLNDPLVKAVDNHAVDVMIRSRGDDKGHVGAVCHRHCAGRGDRSVADDGGGDGIAVDGEVGSDEIENLRKQIITHGAEVRCMVVGIGASLGGAFVETIAGESNILGEEHADSVIMDTIRAMLE